MANVKPKSTHQTLQGQLVRFSPFFVGFIILVLLPMFLPAYVQTIWTKFLIFAIFATSFDLVYGHAGLLSLGHAAFFGAGGYVVGVLLLHYEISSFWVCAPLGVIVASIMAAVFGFISLRVSGMYFLLVTFALAQLLYSIAWNWLWLNSPGMQGIAGIARPDLGISWFKWTPLFFYYFVFIIFVLCFYLIYRIMNSPFGYSLRGIRESELRMESLGYNTWLHKYIVFIVTGAFSGIAGVLFAYFNRLISPVHLAVGTSFLPMCMVIIGGSGTLLGPVIGAMALVFVEYFSSLFTPERWPLILGGLFVAVIMYARGGIMVYLSGIWKRIGYH
jgi:branched-chain amino acid transport system permease protein